MLYAALFVSLLSLVAYAQTDLPERGSIEEIRGKSRYYLNADAYSARLIDPHLKMKRVDKAEDADFIIEYRKLSELYLGGGAGTMETGEMTVYRYRDGKKVIVWQRDDSGVAPMRGLAKRFRREMQAKK